MVRRILPCHRAQLEGCRHLLAAPRDPQVQVRIQRRRLHGLQARPALQALKEPWPQAQAPLGVLGQAGAVPRARPQCPRRSLQPMLAVLAAETPELVRTSPMGCRRAGLSVAAQWGSQRPGPANLTRADKWATPAANLPRAPRTTR